MRKVCVLVNGISAGTLEELGNQHYRFDYFPDYQGAPVSLTMPLQNISYEFNQFPPFFEGLLPEGILLEALLRKHKLDKKDYLGQLIKIGDDVVGAVTVKEI